jgi:hypothetical protein
MGLGTTFRSWPQPPWPARARAIYLARPSRAQERVLNTKLWFSRRSMPLPLPPWRPVESPIFPGSRREIHSSRAPLQYSVRPRTATAPQLIGEGYVQCYAHPIWIIVLARSDEGCAGGSSEAAVGKRFAISTCCLSKGRSSRWWAEEIVAEDPVPSEPFSAKFPVTGKNTGNFARFPAEQLPLNSLKMPFQSHPFSPSAPV